MTDEREWLGKGWRFPVAVNLTGGISTSSKEDNIKESIFIILGTAPGERLNRPDFGCDIHELMFSPNNPTTASLAEYYCESALSKWEPRISNVKADANPSSDEPNRMDIRITYTIKETNSSRNLVYPFYLQHREDGA